jgi:hypothetical protein
MVEDSQSKRCLFSGMIPVAKNVKASVAKAKMDFPKLTKTGSKKGQRAKHVKQLSNIRIGIQSSDKPDSPIPKIEPQKPVKLKPRLHAHFDLLIRFQVV